MRWTVLVPMPSDFATFKIPTPLVSCFRTFRSVALSIANRTRFRKQIDIRTFAYHIRAGDREFCA